MYHTITNKDGVIAVNIFDDGATVPFIYQPHWPDGTLWASESEAESWALAKIAENDPSVTVQAGPNPSNPVIPKPTEEELRLARLQRLGLTVEDLKALLGLE